MNFFESLPYDVLFNITNNLSFEDIVNLSRASPLTWSLLSEETVCRRTVEKHMPHTREAQLARMYTKEAQLAHIENRPKRHKVDRPYRAALQRIHTRHQAYATASPVSAAILSYSSASFLYSDGVLCYQSEGYVRVLDIHASASKECVINISSLIISTINPPPKNPRTGRFTLLNYSHGIIACLYQSKGLNAPAYLLAINVGIGGTKPGRCILAFPIEGTTNKMIARHNDKYLYFGTHNLDEEGHREWCFTGINLVDGSRMDAQVKPNKFIGSDINSNVTFTIHGSYFYALSSQRCFEEVDYTSCYHCVRFLLSDPLEVEIRDKIWRRQHTEGPINDLWTDLRLLPDERTGELLIVEARREWRKGAPQTQRTYYMQPLPPAFAPGTDNTGTPLGSSPQQSPVDLSGSSDSSLTNNVDAEMLDPPAEEGETANLATQHTSASHTASPRRLHDLPEEDRQIEPLLRKTDAPHYQKERPRLPRYVHEGDNALTKRTFILARTKLRAYNPAANAFLDLVDDPVTDPITHATRSRLRIRVGARKLKPPARKEGFLKGPGIDERTGEAFEEGMQEEYEPLNPDGPILWPPSPPSSPRMGPTQVPSIDEAELALLTNILNPTGPPSSGQAGPMAVSPAADVHALSDAHCVVYSTPYPTPPGQKQKRALVLINFDAAVGIPRPADNAAELTEVQKPPATAKENFLLQETVGVGSQQEPMEIERPRWWREEPARWVSVGLGWRAHR